ncbi:MAG TPA: AAA family ATPase [Candidatus Wallbacteria bacterium]|nr:AAA family ATPase [Candidatus Wallbacteria bacterium]
MIFLSSLKYNRPEVLKSEFPFNINLMNNFEGIEFDSPVTIFVGENGTGKSTLLEGLAAAAGSIAAGNESIKTDKTLAHARKLGKQFKLVWKKRTHRGFFLRSEDFFNFTRRVSELRAEMNQYLDEIEEEYKGRSEKAKQYARIPYAGSLAGLTQKYGEDLDANSHGESFLKFFQSRFVPEGLYILDEPEAPLSPIRQMAFISMLKEMTGEGSQFIIATHSPILMAFPEARIISFDETPPRAVKYDDLAQVNLMKDFLNNPGQFLKNL